MGPAELSEKLWDQRRKGGEISAASRASGRERVVRG